MGAVDVRALAAVGARGVMTYLPLKAARFSWRASRNLICAIPGGARLLFPARRLATQFGRGDALYALHVYRHHVRQLEQAGFTGASMILEVGPGQNLGSGLLWWSRAVAVGQSNVRVTFWDVYPNANPHASGFWPALAREVLDAMKSADDDGASVGPEHRDILREVASGRRKPEVEYIVCKLRHLRSLLQERRFDLVWSHAALEHVWRIDELWPILSGLTLPAGWHSHRIDLADHGRRESNCVEMLEWSSLSWWLTMRFVPGAINRKRASECEAALASHGVRIASAKREQRETLPVPRRRLARRYRDMDEAELRTTAIDLVGFRADARCGS